MAVVFKWETMVITLVFNFGYCLGQDFGFGVENKMKEIFFLWGNFPFIWMFPLKINLPSPEQRLAHSAGTFQDKCFIFTG